MSVAIVIGGSGLVGAQLIDELLADDRFSNVVSLGRRPLERAPNAKLEQHSIDFRKPESWSQLVKGDVLFSSLGTTAKKAGSKEAQYEVDHTFQLHGARAAKEQGVPSYVLVSAAGADASSSLFYNRMKGELDRDVAALGFERCHVLRPSILEGDRQESRPGEAFGIAAMKAFKFIPGLKKYRPIHVNTVARAMIAAALDPRPGSFVHEPGELFELAAGVPRAAQ